MNRLSFGMGSPFPSSGNDLHVTGLAVLACGVLLVAAVIVVIVQMVRERR